MTSPADPAPGRADAQRNRERVLEAVFALSGDLHELSLDDIARQAGVGRSTLFRHFATRDELLLAATLRAIEEGRATAHAVVEQGGSAPEVFERLSRDIARLAARFRVLHASRALAAQLVEPAAGDDPLLAWIVAAQARGELRRELTPRWIMQMLIALAMASADQLRDPEQDQAAVAAMLAQTLIGAFVAPAGTAGAPAGDDD